MPELQLRLVTKDQDLLPVGQQSPPICLCPQFSALSNYYDRLDAGRIWMKIRQDQILDVLPDELEPSFNSAG